MFWLVFKVSFGVGGILGFRVEGLRIWRICRQIPRKYGIIIQVTKSYLPHRGTNKKSKLPFEKGYYNNASFLEGRTSDLNCGVGWGRSR